MEKVICQACNKILTTKSEIMLHRFWDHKSGDTTKKQNVKSKTNQKTTSRNRKSR